MSAVDTIFANLSALGFNNASATAIYNKIAQAIGIPIDNTIQEMTNSENNILNTINTQRYGKSGYYIAKALAFQYGDDLVIDPVTLEDVYAIIDPAKQIVSQAAFEEIAALLFLKVATTNSISGDLEPLTELELASFKDYMLNFELPGLPLSIISAAPNILSFDGNITYYKTFNLTTLQANIVAALSAFRRSFTFDGVFFTGDLETYLRTNVPGLRDVYLYNTTVDGLPFGGSQSLSAGYFNYITGIDSRLTYIAV